MGREGKRHKQRSSDSDCMAAVSDGPDNPTKSPCGTYLLHRHTALHALADFAAPPAAARNRYPRHEPIVHL